VEEAVVVVLVVAAVAATAEVEVERVEAELPAAEVESASADPDSVVGRACALLIRVPGSFILRFDRPPLRERIAG
jgi:hypothetical protein